LHIKNHKTSKAISVGEDATCVVARIDYDCETDRCVGFVLPLDSNGLPLVDSFLAASCKAIEEIVCIHGPTDIFKCSTILSSLP